MRTTEGQMVVGWITEKGRAAQIAQNAYADAMNAVDHLEREIKAFGDSVGRADALMQAQGWRTRAGDDLAKALDSLNAAIRAYVDWYPSDDLGVEIKGDD